MLAIDSNLNISEILNAAVTDISKRVAKLDMVKVNKAEFDTQNIYSLITSTSGDYDFTAILCTDKRVLRVIAENMKRKTSINDAEIPIYTIEYFNILCGHVVTAINNITRKRARFSVPHMVKGMISNQEPFETAEHYILFFNCPYGLIKVDALYQCRSLLLHD